MKSHILFPSGKTITFEIDSCRSIFDLKRHIRDEQGVPLDLLVLKHENVEMTDATPLSLLCSDSNEANLKAFIDLDGGQGCCSMRGESPAAKCELCCCYGGFHCKFNNIFCCCVQLSLGDCQ